MSFKKGNFILQWKDTEKLAWGILLNLIAVGLLILYYQFVISLFV
jgi:hypothetical protein|tara:strand:- start:191 stop:325 length:135 start_codon:yes stop_codon:yes gene_type:complete